MFELLFSKEEKFLGLLIDKMYCKSITGVLNFILNCRLDYRLIAQSLREQRIEGFEKVFSIMLESAGDQDKIEYHLSAVSILTELLQNYEAVFDGKAIVKEVILKQSQFELLIAQLSANVNASDKTKKSLGNLPNIIHLAFEFARKNILECQDCRILASLSR